MKILIKDPNAMNLDDFIKKIDREGAVVLLEGKREVLKADEDALIAIGKLLTEKSAHIMFRSGNAKGADYFFSLGVAAVNPYRLQVITPNNNHRAGENLAMETISLENINMVNEYDILYTSKKNPKAKSLVEQYILGKNKRLAAQGALLLRDTIKVTGTKSGVAPATFGIFYDDLSSPESGGTGHTMKMCKEKMVPYVTQKVWKNWLNQY